MECQGAVVANNHFKSIWNTEVLTKTKEQHANETTKGVCTGTHQRKDAKTEPIERSAESASRFSIGNHLRIINHEHHFLIIDCLSLPNITAFQICISMFA